MPLQYLTDSTGLQTAVMIPMEEWKMLTAKHQDLQDLETTNSNPQQKIADLAGKLPLETADAMHRYVEESRNEWEERLKKQF